MIYAVIKTGGKQYKVEPGDVIEVEQLNAKPNDKHTFSDVLLYVANGSAKFGNPLVSGITVGAVILEHIKGDKLRISKFKAKAKYRRVTGHRQHLTKVKIESVGSEKAILAKKPTVEKMVETPVVKLRKTAGKK